MKQLVDRMEKYFKIFYIFFKQSLAKLFIYRTSGFICIIYSLIYLAGGYLSIKVFFYQRSELAGWKEGEMLILMGAFQLMTGLFDTLFLWAQDSIPAEIVEGQLDVPLLRPVNTLFLICSREIYIPGLVGLPISGLMILQGLQNASLQPSFLNFIFFAIFMIVGVLVMFSITQIVLNLSFWIEGFSGIWAFADEFIKLGSRPLKMYSAIFRTIFGTCLPVVTAINLPANILRNSVEPTDIVLTLLFVVVLLLFMNFQFHCGLRRYQGAS